MKVLASLVINFTVDDCNDLVCRVLYTNVKPIRQSVYTPDGWCINPDNYLCTDIESEYLVIPASAENVPHTWDMSEDDCYGNDKDRNYIHRIVEAFRYYIKTKPQMLASVELPDATKFPARDGDYGVYIF